jgi:hypothetical protein
MTDWTWPDWATKALIVIGVLAVLDAVLWWIAEGRHLRWRR